MKTLFKLIALALVVAIGGFAYVASQQPADFSITRSATIDAPADVVFSHVNNLHAWEAWSPWAKLDPNATATYEGPEAGEGAKMAWNGNYEVGQGSMTITSSEPNNQITFQLDFVKPMKATNKAQFTFAPEGDKTLVTWSMSGTNTFIGKAMSLLFNCEKMVGGQFEQGLSDLNKVVAQ